MALITTPGADNAGSYVNVVDFKAYAGNMGYDLTGKTDEQTEQALRRGTRWIDSTYGPRFVGQPTSVTQALEWPRTGATWRGSTLPVDAIPSQVKNATSEAAWRELTTPGSLSPDYVAAERVVREKVGELEVQYSDKITSASDALPVISIIDGILAGLLTSKGSILFGLVARV